MTEDLDRLIDVLHAIRFQRQHHGSGAETQEYTDQLVSMLVAGELNTTRGMPTVYAEIAKRILEAEANWNKDTGRTHCGQMAPV